VPWRDHLGKTGGALMAAAFASAVGYLIASNTGTPTPSTKKPPTPVPGPPLWPYALCGAMFVVGLILYGAAHGWLPLRQTRRALKRRAETAESELKEARRERDEARCDLEAAQRAVASSEHEAKAPPKTGLEVVIDREIQTPRPGVGRILEIEYRVTNHDPMEHALFRSMEGSIDGQFYHGPLDGQPDLEHQRFIQEAHRIEEGRSRDVPGRVRVGETVHGVYVARFAWDPCRKLPDYTLVISDGRREFRVRPHGAAGSAPAKPEPPPFKLRHYTGEVPLAGGRVTSHFVGVANPAGQPERRAHVSVEGMNPYARNRSVFGVEPAFPHAVPPESGGDPAAGLVIRPGQEQSWFIGNTLIGGDGKISVYRFFSDTGASWELGPDERWRLSYRIACGGVPDVPFSIVIAAEEGTVALRLEG
jgi:hypothetical protein